MLVYFLKHPIQLLRTGKNYRHFDNSQNSESEFQYEGEVVRKASVMSTTPPPVRFRRLNTYNLYLTGLEKVYNLQSHRVQWGRVPTTAGFTYLFAIDSKREKSCSDWSVCGSKSIAFLMMSNACIFHRGSKGITNSSGLKNKTQK